MGSPAGSRICTLSGVSSTVTWRRALVTPSKKFAGPVVVMLRQFALGGALRFRASLRQAIGNTDRDNPGEFPDGRRCLRRSHAAGAQRVDQPLADRGGRPGPPGPHALRLLEAGNVDRVDHGAP